MNPESLCLPSWLACERHKALLRLRDDTTARIAAVRASHGSVARLYERQSRIVRELLVLERGAA